MNENINTIKQVVLLAGGLGTRLKPYTDTAPKPMYPINGIPFIRHLVEQIKGFGIERILLLLGYRAEKIVDYLESNDSFEINISYDITPVQFNTGDRLLHAQNLIDEKFMLMYCDNYCPIDFFQLCQDFENNKAWIQLSAYENADGYTKSNLLAENGMVTIYDKKRTEPNLQGVDIGYAIIDKRVLRYVTGKNINFEAMVYPELINQRKLYVTITKHRYYSIGSWERIELTKKFFGNCPTVFLDRDGTINKRAAKACYIEKPSQFVWLEGAKEAIRILKDFGYRVILVSNQPGIARKNFTEETLQQIHVKMQEELRQEIGYQIDDIYYCPHDWDDGCECRKPKPGMLYQAQRDYNLNLTQCVLIGDDDRDMEAGNSAGCKTYQVTDDRNLLQIVKEMVKGK
jgi:D-glycero-D-manno-heptose 1,7-bisphosphate phosphatase